MQLTKVTKDVYILEGITNSSGQSTAVYLSKEEVNELKLILNTRTNG